MVNAWEIVVYVYLLKGGMYTERITYPTFPNESLCEMFIELPRFQDDLIIKFWSLKGVAYVLPKCEHIVEV